MPGGYEIRLAYPKGDYILKSRNKIKKTTYSRWRDIFCSVGNEF
jgi:hypothetical protein